MTSFVVQPQTSALAGTVTVPGDKSIGHRAMLFAALGSGRCRVTGLSTGADNESTRLAMASMGVAMERDGDGAWLVDGVGLGGLSPLGKAIDCGNAGTAMRLLCGVLAGQSFDSVLIGDHSLTRRPMKRIADPLALMGARIEGRRENDNLYPPLTIRGGATLVGIDYALPVASAQVKSAVLLAGLYADGATRVVEPGSSRDHTERMLAAMGAPIRRVSQREAILDPSGWDRRLEPRDWLVPADPSSAAFVVAAAMVAAVDRVIVRGVCTNPTRTGFLDVLAAMGAEIGTANVAEAGEPVADLVIEQGGNELTATRVGGDLTVRSIDELPVLAVVAAFAAGQTDFVDAAELRVKESDRIATTVAMLSAFGVEVDERRDGFTVHGDPGRTLEGAVIDAAGDHRIAMAAAVAGLRASSPTRIEDVDNVKTSFPSFVDVLRSLGVAMSVE